LFWQWLLLLLTENEPMASATATKTVLHVGCGSKVSQTLHPTFQTAEWQEIRLDIDPDYQPDIVANIMDMSVVGSESVDAIWSSHNLEHLFSHEVPVALREFHRVLKPDGFALITLPDLQKVAAHIAQGRLEDVLYVSPAGPISAIDVVYGHRAAVARGKVHMAHKTGFTAQSLGQKLFDAGFAQIEVKQDNGLALWALAIKAPVSRLPHIMA
jgi:SAM-dependent methyltransferase